MEMVELPETGRMPGSGSRGFRKRSRCHHETTNHARHSDVGFLAGTVRWLRIHEPGVPVPRTVRTRLRWLGTSLPSVLSPGLPSRILSAKADLVLCTCVSPVQTGLRSLRPRVSAMWSRVRPLRPDMCSLRANMFSVRAVALPQRHVWSELAAPACRQDR